MKAATIIHECNLIYELMRNPPNIILHQKRVAGVAAFILDHWKGPTVNREVVIAAALMHDLANITKATLDDSQFTRDMLQEEYARLAYWQRVKAEVIAKYGEQEHAATDAMLAEIDAPKAVRDLILQIDFKRNSEIAASNSWEQKILAHADHLVSPYGITSLDERLAEGRRRYAKRLHLLGSSDAEQAAYEIARQVAAQLTVPPSAITDEAVAPYIKSF